MKQIIILLQMLLVMAANAQQNNEYIRIVCDKDIYMAGERMNIALDVTDVEGNPSSLSSVVYVELSNARRMVAQGMAKMHEGQGEISIDIPAYSSSGTYQLTAYTRYMRNFGEAAFKRQEVGVVNVLHISHDDRVIFTERDTLARLTNGGIANKRNYQLGEPIRVALPDSDVYRALSIEPLSCLSEQAFASRPQDFSAANSGVFIPELEGHIVDSRTLEPGVSADRSRLALVGRATRIFDGQSVGDSLYRFYTTDIESRQPVMVSGFDFEGNPVELTIVSPYVKVKAVSLAPLNLYYNRSAIERRALEVKQHGEENIAPLDSVEFTTDFMSAQPDRFYDLTEYTRFTSVKDILTEFVRGVRREKHDGHYQLFTFDNVSQRFSKWPALLLLDGAPVDDADKVLAFDAGLLRYVKIYNGTFTFGESIRQGVISLVSIKGRLSNLELDKGAKLFTYSFPSAIKPEETHRWIVNPQKRLVIEAPAHAGLYKITAFGSKGRNVAIVEVK